MEILAGLLITALLTLALWVLYTGALSRPECDVLILAPGDEVEQIRRAAKCSGADTLLILKNGANEDTLKRYRKHFTIQKIMEEETDGAGNA